MHRFTDIVMFALWSSTLRDFNNHSKRDEEEKWGKIPEGADWWYLCWVDMKMRDGHQAKISEHWKNFFAERRERDIARSK
jgi:hypothetical protein